MKFQQALFKRNRRRKNMFSDLKKLALLGALFVSAQGYAYTEDQSDFGFGVEAIMGINGGVNCNYDGAAKIKNPVGGPEVGLALYFRAFKFYIGADGRFEYDAFRSLHKVYSQSILSDNNVKTGDKDYSEGFSFADSQRVNLIVTYPIY